MTECMATDALGDAGFVNGEFNSLLQTRLKNRMSSC